jgi:peptidyl-prolyl cis-trans isomerase C
MLMNKWSLAAAVFGAAALITQPAVAQNAADGNAVVAEVNGEKILKKDVLGAMETMTVKPEDAEKVFPMVVDQMINEKLIDIETTRANIEADAKFQQQLQAAKSRLIKTVYLENYLKDRVNDKAVKEEYARLKKENKGKQEVRARHILVATEEEAKQVIKELQAGAKFEDLAKKRSSGPGAENGGDVGYFAKGELIPEFSDAAFNLKPGNYSKEPVKTPFGWHVIYVEDKRTRKVPDLKDVEASIRTKLGQEAIENLVQGLRAKADIKRFGADGSVIPANALMKN